MAEGWDVGKKCLKGSVWGLRRKHGRDGVRIEGWGFGLVGKRKRKHIGKRVVMGKGITTS